MVELLKKKPFQNDNKEIPAVAGKSVFSYVRSRLVLPYNILKCRLTGTYKPLVVLFYVNDKCNLRCKYCVGNWSARKIPDFTTEEIIRVVDECAELGTCHFTVHGGEILLRDDVEYMVNYMKNKDLYVNIVTNGLLLPKKIHEIRNADSLCISLDGPEESNDITRGKGSYKAIMEAIKVAKQEGFNLSVQATLTKYNKNDIGYLVTQAREMGYFQQFSLLLKPLSEELEHIGLDHNETKQVLEEIIKYKRQGYPVFTSYRTLENALNWPLSYSKPMLNLEEIPSDSNLIRCYYGKLKVAIDADGNVYPCSSLNTEFKALNVRDVGVKKAYEHVLKTNRCESCMFLTQNDWSLLLGLSKTQYLEQTKIQLKQLFNRY